MFFFSYLHNILRPRIFVNAAEGMATCGYMEMGSSKSVENKCATIEVRSKDGFPFIVNEEKAMLYLDVC